MKIRSLPRRRAMALAITLALAATAADAATITVTSTADGPVTADAVCTLREALESLNNGANTGGCVATGAFGTADAVNITATGTIALAPAEGALSIEVPSTITGPGAAQLTISGGGATSVLYAYGGTIAVSGVTIANGDSGTPGAGGVTAFYAALTLSDCTISNNTGGYAGGVLGVDSAIITSNCTLSGNSGVTGGALGLLGGAGQINGSVVTGNTSGAVTNMPARRAGREFWSNRPEGSGIKFRRAEAPAGGPPGLGGGVTSFGDFFGGKGMEAPSGGPALQISGSTISGNNAGQIGGGVFLYGTNSVVVDSTISGNTAAAAGGGFFVGESGFDMLNSTVSGNTATGTGPFTGGGGFLLYGGPGMPVELGSTTITGNTAQTGGGGILTDGPISLQLASTILANSLGAAGADIATQGQAAATITATTSLVEAVGNSGITATGGNLVAVDPQLGPLANNGGPTLTHLPGATSPVLNVGANPGGAAFDQRGSPFARVVGPAADIGSIEVPAGVPPSPSFTPRVPTTTTWGGLLLAAALAAVAWFRRPQWSPRRRKR